MLSVFQGKQLLVSETDDVTGLIFTSTKLNMKKSTVTRPISPVDLPNVKTFQLIPRLLKKGTGSITDQNS